MKPNICDFLPIPDLLKAESVLCIQPHSDDMEIGAGATIARLARSGTAVTCLTVTDGSAGTYDPALSQNDLIQTRQRETEKASRRLGVNRIIRLDFTDGGNLPYEGVRAEITRAIRDIKPAAVLVCDPWLPYEAHTDHIRTGLAAAEACLLSSMPYFCPEHIKAGIKPHAVDIIAFYYSAYPNTYIDVTDSWDIKLSAIDCHESQFAPDKREMLKIFLTAKARQYAAEQGCELVEAFKVLTTFHLHIFEEAWRC